MEARRKLMSVIIHIILILMSITMLVPFLWMVLTAFKSVSEATQVNPFLIFPTVWRTESFTEVMDNMNFILLYKNTLLMIFFRVVCAVLTATMAGYAFARLNFKGRDFMFSLVLFQMMIPSQIFIIPQYQTGWLQYRSDFPVHHGASYPFQHGCPGNLYSGICFQRSDVANDR